MKQTIQTKHLLNLNETCAASLLEQFEYPWQALPHISDFVISLGKTLSPDEYEQKEEHVWIARSATVFPSAYITGPTIIGPNTEVRHCAFIRGNALVGANCVVGNSTELKNVILFICTFVGINAVCEMLSATVITGAVGAALYKARLLPETEKKSEKVVKTAEV